MCTIRPVDAEIARIAARAHRIVTREDMRRVGMSRHAIAHAIDRLGLVRLWPETYLLGPQPPDRLSLAMGAVRSYHGNGVLGFGWAGGLWACIGWPDFPIDVIVTAGTRASRPRVRAHAARALDPRDVTIRRNIPVTTPARTCLDYAETAERNDLERLVAEAQVKGLVREAELHALIARSPGRRGVPNLRAVLAAGPQYTAVESERRMLALVREGDLPRPEANARVLRYVVDFLWRSQRVIVEVDGFSTHGHRRAFEYDRRRQQQLTAAGYRVMHVTWRQLANEPMAVATRIAAALAHAEAAA